MNFKNVDEVRELYSAKFNTHQNAERETKHLAQMLMYRFLSEIERLMDEREMSKKELAAKIGVSASYITQLYRGTKPLNIETLAKIELALDFSFEIKAVEKSLLEMDDSLQQNWSEEQVNRLIKKFYSNDGFWMFRKHAFSTSNLLHKSKEIEYSKLPQHLENTRKVA